MAVRKLEIYRCNICGDMVEITRAGGGDLVCCGEKMQLLEENTTDAATEKHVPVVESVEGGIKARIGSTPHPMEEKHFIEWVEVIDAEGRAYRQFLEPGQKPEAVFLVKNEGVTVREFCNVHGLWKA